MSTTRKGDWMQTFSGVQFYLMDPRPEDVSIRDIAHHLSLLCRYNGAVAYFYSVAEHSVALSYVVPAHLAMQALMHDAAEAYTGDPTRPLKNNIGRDVWDAIADPIDKAIAEQLGLVYPWDQLIDEYDTRILGDERTALMPGRQLPWTPSGDRLGVVVRGLNPPDAEHEFMARYEELSRRVVTKPAVITKHNDDADFEATRQGELDQRQAARVLSGDDGAPIPAFLKERLTDA